LPITKRLALGFATVAAAGTLVATVATVPASAAPVPTARAQAAVAALQAKGARCTAATGTAGTYSRCTAVKKASLNSLTPAQRQHLSATNSKLTSGARPSATGRASGAAITITPPSQCEFDFFEGYSPAPDRFTSCLESSWTLTDTTVSSTGGVEITGTFEWDDEQWTSYSATSSAWTHGMIFSAGTGSGDLLDGFSLELYSGCFLAQGVCTAVSQTNPDPQTIDVAPLGTYEFQWQEVDNGPSSTTANTDNVLDPYLGVQYLATGGNGVPAEPAFDGGLDGRCDTIVSSTDGCVNEDNTPVVTYNGTSAGNPLVAPVAQHIYTAQTTLSIAWGVPAVFNSKGQPLHRDTSAADQTANNRVACASVVLGAGQNCDEFPLATTFEGAAFQPVWSAVAVPASANSSQGGITSNFYKTNRVIDDDAFNVLAIKANGQASW